MKTVKTTATEMAPGLAAESGLHLPHQALQALIGKLQLAAAVQQTQGLIILHDSSTDGLLDFHLPLGTSPHPWLKSFL